MEGTDSKDISDGAPKLSRLPSKDRAGKKNMKVAGKFVQASTENLARKSRMNDFLKSIYLANFMAAVVLVDAYCTCVDIDATAAGTQPPEISSLISSLCLVTYTLEIAALLSVFGVRASFSDWFMALDLIIVGCGWAEEAISVFSDGGLNFRTAVLRALRLVRIFRLARALKRIRPLRELYKLAIMMATCFRALLWCFLLCFVVMTVWAMLIVEVVSPFVKEMHADMDRDFFKACHPQCTKAVSTVMDANLLLFKTVIAGDAWGEIAVPVIQEHPATFIIFIGSSLTLVFGVLNLIVAVVVDTFAESRQSDVQSLAEEMEDEIEHDRAALGKLFARMDRDRSGKLTLSELMEGAQSDSEFRGRLRVMDIDEQDLESLFYMIDEDQSGTIDVAEFIGPLSRWAHDSKTAPRFIKYNMIQTMNLQEELYDLSVECFQQLAAKIDGVARSVAEPRPPLLSAAGQARGQEDVRSDRDAAYRKSDSAASEMITGDLQEHRQNPDGPGSDSPSAPALHCDAEAEVVQPPPSPQPVEFLGAGGQPMVNVEAALASAMSRLEAKLDLMLADAWVRPRIPSQPRGPGEEDLASFEKELERRKTARKVHHNDGFRRMYMMEPTRTKDEDHPHRRGSARLSHREERVASSLNNQDSPFSFGDSHAKPVSPSFQRGLNR